MKENAIRFAVGTVLTIADCVIIGRISKKRRERKEAEKTAQGLMNYYRLRSEQYNTLISEATKNLENEEDEETRKTYVNSIANWKAAMVDLDKEFGTIVK